VYGVACKRVDVRERRSVFNSRPRFRAAVGELLGAIRVPVIVASFSDEGYMSREEMQEMLAGLRGGETRVLTIATDFPRYVGARIGIYNPRGERVGRVGRLRNTEYVFVAAAPEVIHRIERSRSMADHRSRGFVAAAG
jgi:adenine-specific DNA-methyltransferase